MKLQDDEEFTKEYTLDELIFIFDKHALQYDLYTQKSSDYFNLPLALMTLAKEIKALKECKKSN